GMMRSAPGCATRSRTPGTGFGGAGSASRGRASGDVVGPLTVAPLGARALQKVGPAKTAPVAPRTTSAATDARAWTIAAGPGEAVPLRAVSPGRTVAGLPSITVSAAKSADPRSWRDCEDATPGRPSSMPASRADDTGRMGGPPRSVSGGVTVD